MSNIVIRSYKIRIYPTQEQIKIINQTLGACRWIYNDFLEVNIQRYKDGLSYISGYTYSNMLTELKKSDPTYIWLNTISSKAILKSFMNCDDAFKRFFKNKTGFPRFKSRKKNPVRGYYFITDKIKFKHNYINLPILKWTKISQNSYVPQNRKFVGGTIMKDIDGRYYISLRVYHDFNDLYQGEYYNTTNGIGIDVGIKTFITGYSKNGIPFIIPKFINDSVIKRYEEKIVNLQRIISNKMEINYGKLLNIYLDNHHGEEPNEAYKNIMKGESYSNECIKLQHKINVYKKKIHNYKIDKINKIVIKLVRSKPKYITIENLSVKSLLENNASSELHKYIQDSMFRYFFNKLIEKVNYYGIELRQADKFFASSKKCCSCGYKLKHLSLNDRIFMCSKCGNILDRDLNAAVNLCNLKKYTIINSL